MGKLTAALLDALRAERGDQIGPIRFMAAADGYVMVRRPHCPPWVEPVSAWVARPLETSASVTRAAYSAVRHAIDGERG